jgi:hypothetical protein
MRRLFLILLFCAAPVAAQDALPGLDGARSWRVLAPLGDRVIVQDDRGISFLCDVVPEARAMLQGCRAMLTDGAVAAYDARAQRAVREQAAQTERSRIETLPLVIRSRAAAKVLELQGCVLDLANRRLVLESAIPNFADALGVPQDLRADLSRFLDAAFEDALEGLLARGELLLDRGGRRAMLLECAQ